MAKKNAGDILTSDWNPVIGCERYSAGCRSCWYLDGIFPWQQRLGNIPPGVQPNQHHVFPSRLTEESLKGKNGIVGIVQHGDLFWDAVPDQIIFRILEIAEKVAGAKRKVPKYMLWTKRAERMARILNTRYPHGLPNWLAVAVSVENQAAASDRLPYLAGIRGTRIIMLEPLLESVSISRFLPVEWVVVGSETGESPRPIDRAWVASIRDETKAREIPFFIKQLGTSHKVQDRSLDGRTWDEFPVGFEK
ncbi:MAG: DUF5131 family protein [Treponema sp.]|nr:DUF5131 family protein [Treponema sp.]